MVTRVGSLAIAIGSLGLLALPAGCENRLSGVQVESADMAAYSELVIPHKLKIQPFTQPVSFARDGQPDGIEVILSATDAFNDPVKSVGTFQFELSEFRKASGDPVGERLAFWTVKIDSKEALEKYWDRISRFHRFPLHHEGGQVRPGKYVLSVRLSVPGGDRLFDEFELTVDPKKPAPPPLGG